MLQKIIAFSVGNKLIIGLFVFALVLFGIYNTTKLPIDAVPDITDNQVQVITIAPSFGATDIERLVTFPIEQANNNISGLKEIRSFSRFGLSLVTIVFTDETDIYWARQQVNERLQKVQNEIPKGIGIPELGPVSTGLGEIYQYVVRAKKGYEKKYNETDLRTIQDWIVRRQLLGVKGIAEVSSFGGKLKQYEIAINPNKLQSFGITINDVFSAIEKNNENTGGAYIEKGPTVLFIRSEGLVGSIKDIENISIETKNGQTPLFIRDVADVKLGFATRYGAMCYNDEGEVSGAVVMMLKGANSSEVVKNVKQRIVQIQKTLPEGVIIEPFLDRTKMVNHAIGTVSKNLLEGALIVIFVLVIFLGNLRAGLLVASVIPLAMLFAISMMNMFGVSGNLMSLGALDFGLIVDGAVIIVEAIMHNLVFNKKLSQSGQLTQTQMDIEVNESSSKMMNSAVFGQIIILIVYLPIFSLNGIEGKMFKPMAQTVAFALLGAFILSLTYIPMMSTLFLSKKTKSKENISDKVMNKVSLGYEKMLVKLIQIPKTILTTTVLLFVVSLIVLSRLGGEFIPALEEGDFAIDTRVLTGSNINTSIESTQKAVHILKSRFPEVEKIVTKIGSGEVPTDPMPMEAADMMVILKDKKDWTSAKTFDELAKKMGDAISEVPGITAGFQYPVQMRFNELMTGARQDVVCKIFGENLDTLALYAHKLGQIVNTVSGAQNLYVEPIAGMPQVIIEYNRALIAQYNLNIVDVNKVINTAFAGQTAGLVFEGEKRFDLVIRLQTDKRKNLEDVQNLLIPTPQGLQIPLSQLANVVIKNGVNQIQREDAKRRIVVGFNIKGRDVQSIVHELQKKVETDVKFPAGYFVTYGGAFENLNKAKNRLMIAVPISLLLIFVFLYFAFNSIKHGLLIYTAIPLSAIGGILFLALRGMPFSISAGVGFIALFGVAVLNGIVLIAEFNRLKKEGLLDLKQVVIQGTKLRLRPVLMTAFVASLGFLPMALSNGAGAEVQRPLATVVIGGLLIATFLTLFVLPILYLIFEKKSKPNNMKHTIALIAVFLLSFGKQTFAQTEISLNLAIETALKNNASIKNEKLKAAYKQQLIKSARQMPNINIGGNYGQINSIYIDNQFFVSQSFLLPQIYKANKTLFTEDYILSKTNVLLRETELKKQITSTYFELVNLNAKQILLQKLDTIYTEFLRKATMRLQKGESNILEQATAETQKNNLQMQLNDLDQSILSAQLYFQLLLNTETKYSVDNTELTTIEPNLTDSSLVLNNPLLLQLFQQQNIIKANTALEKAKLLPTLNLGVNSGSMIGTGADNINYNKMPRFNSVQMGVSFPLFNGGQKARVVASKLNENIAEKEYQLKEMALKNELEILILKLKTSKTNLEYFKTIGLKNAAIINKTANKQFSNGEINYLDWVQLMFQSISIENNYLDTLKVYNETIISINYLIN